MTRIVPHPLLTCALIVMWLLLNRFSLGHLLLGTAVALVAGRAMAALDPVAAAHPPLGRGAAAVRHRHARHRPLEPRRGPADRRRPARGPAARASSRSTSQLRDPTALAALAVIVTSTPGTAWLDWDAARGRLLLHVLDLGDEDEWRDLVNNRYGRMLKEIFE